MKNFPRVFKKKTIRWTAGSFILLTAAAVVIFWFSATRPPVIAESGLQIGSRGPFEIPFNKKMQVKSVEQSIVIDPPVNGQFSWEGSTVRYWPSDPLNVVTAYRVTLLPGSKSADGRAIRETASWQFTVRNPLVAFLHPAASPELWLYDPVDESVRQISHTGGKVYDFGSSTAGNQVAFSAANSQGGIDLWQYSRKTEAVEKILDCGRDWCFNPAWSPADDRIAYTRRAAGEEEADQPGVPRVHILEYSSAKDWILYDTDSVAGYSPRWSPDGRYLAFFDTIAAGIRPGQWQSGCGSNSIGLNGFVVAGWPTNGFYQLSAGGYRPAFFGGVFFRAADRDPEEIPGGGCQSYGFRCAGLVAGWGVDCNFLAAFRKEPQQTDLADAPGWQRCQGSYRG